MTLPPPRVPLSPSASESSTYARGSLSVRSRSACEGDVLMSGFFLGEMSCGVAGLGGDNGSSSGSGEDAADTVVEPPPEPSRSVSSRSHGEGHDGSRFKDISSYALRPVVPTHVFDGDLNMDS
ncbi:hypothetical protein EVAR_85755_1 [Eumeta japonica]|uniref:Uncharacterized protein n=1 Tax=Eumeta variegata TaxID=151549 RepID=A0A4C1ZGT5_EUMVA|nr:hypothetical protein EVAR_85755_1 [Eumeta japonica]